MGHDRADRPEWKTALISRQLARYRVDIAVLSKTWLGEEGQIGAGYTFFWIEHSRLQCHEAGVGFAIKSNLVNKLAGLPKGVNGHLMTVAATLREAACHTCQCLCPNHDNL